MVDAWCEQQTVFPIESLFVRTIPPRPAMASNQMSWILDKSDPAPRFNEGDTLLA
jgi:hypothetical protein